MNIKMLNKMFKTGSDKDKTSLYLHRPIKEAIELIAEKNGISVSDLVADILDDYLTEYVKAGYLDAPKTALKAVSTRRRQDKEGA